MPLRVDEITIDKKTPVPLYYQLKQQILEKITLGKLSVDEQIPNEIEMQKALGLSRSTIRQALNVLVNSGVLTRKKARGTFVSRPKIEEGFFQKLESFNPEMEKKGLTPSTTVLALKSIAAREEINTRLNLGRDEKLIYLARLRLANNEPVVYLETYLPYLRYPGFLDLDFSVESLYSVLETRYNCRVVKAQREIVATEANARERKVLGMERGRAICLVKTLACAAHDIPVEYSVARYRGDRNTFNVELVRT